MGVIDQRLLGRTLGAQTQSVGCGTIEIVEPSDGGDGGDGGDGTEPGLGISTTELLLGGIGIAGLGTAAFLAGQGQPPIRNLGR